MRGSATYKIKSIRALNILGQQGTCLYAQDHAGRLWYRILPGSPGPVATFRGGEWNPVAR